jgi:hypothetical protein
VIYAVAGEHRGDIPIVRIEGGELTEDARALGAPDELKELDDIGRNAYTFADALQRATDALADPDR